MLININCNFFTYTPKKDKCKTLILKGLNESDKLEVILSSLSNLEIENVIFKKVIRLETNKSRREGKLLAIFVIQITPESNISNAFAIKHLNYQIVGKP